MTPTTEQLAIVLTDEFIDAIASQIGHSLSFSPSFQVRPGTSYSTPDSRAIQMTVRQALLEQRTPLQTLTFKVRASSREAAIRMIDEAAKEGELYMRTAITLLPESEDA